MCRASFISIVMNRSGGSIVELFLPLVIGGEIPFRNVKGEESEGIRELMTCSVNRQMRVTKNLFEWNASHSTPEFLLTQELAIVIVTAHFFS